MNVNYEAIRTRREELGLSDRGLALAAKIDRLVLHRIKHRGSAHPASVLAIARYLGCSVADLAGHADAETIGAGEVTE